MRVNLLNPDGTPLSFPLCAAYNNQHREKRIIGRRARIMTGLLLKGLVALMIVLVLWENYRYTTRL